MNTADFLLENGAGDAPALITANSCCTFNDLRQSAAGMVQSLQSLGIHAGDRVGILGVNSQFWVSAYLAIMKMSGIAVPFATTLTTDEFGAMARLAGCRAIFADRRAMARLIAGIPENCQLIYEDSLDKGTWAWEISIEPFDDHQDAALMFTSGTTAKPRAVRITHRNIQANTESIIEYLGLTASDRMMSILPFYYCFGTSLLHTHLRVGGSLVLSSSFVYPETVLDLLQANHCTGFAGVPSTYQTLLRNSTFPKRQIRSLRRVQQAGGKLQDVLIKELIGAIPEGKVYVMYGQTEATARLSYLPPEQLSTKLGSIGKGIPGVTLKVLGESGNPVKPGEVGEIVAWGENISPGYLDDPEASEQKFVDGALHTTDLATVDEDGYIYVVDRKADFIKSYGYRISSQQIETCILEIPEVVSAGVIGEPDLVRGEAIIAFVVLRDGARVTPEEILAHCNQRLARHMLPKEVVFIDHLPYNSNGKVMKTELRTLVRPKTD